jgi:hypothetical protein
MSIAARAIAAAANNNNNNNETIATHGLFIFNTILLGGTLMRQAFSSSSSMEYDTVSMPV